MSNTEFKITSKGQVTLPKAIRQHLGVSEGEAVRFDIEPDGDVTVRPVITRPKRDPAAFREALLAFGDSIDLMDMDVEGYVDWVRGRD
jgi:AbrB family looped-hinge helix DNA binding protein